MSTATDWMQVSEAPTEVNPLSAKEFFGVPPDPDSALENNISKKRATWNGKTRKRKASPAAQAKVEAALKIIDALADYLTRGLTEPANLDELNQVFREKPRTVVGELEELWRVIEELLASGKLEEALKVGYDALARWPNETTALAAFGWVAAQASRSGSSAATDELRKEGLNAATKALSAGENSADTFLTVAVLQLDLRRGDDALATLIRADGEIPGGATPMLNLCMVEAYVATGDVGQAELRAVAAVNEDSEDLAMRSSVARALVNAMRTHLLPIMDEVQLQRFKHTVAVAAWCAQGAPEAEDLVRPFRMWGVVADNRMYSGDIKKRAFFAVATGYMILPVLNRAKSKPQWQIVRDGPTSVGEDVFAEVMLGAVCRATHASATQRLEWWAEFIAAHPELKSMFGAGVES